MLSGCATLSSQHRRVSSVESALSSQQCRVSKVANACASKDREGEILPFTHFIHVYKRYV